MTMRKTTLRLCLLIWSLIPWVPVCGASAQSVEGLQPPSTAPAKPCVLVLHSYHHGFTWSDNISRGIRSVCESQAGGVALRYEFMDTKHIYSEDHLQELRRLYSLKYAEKPVDVVIASDDRALHFMLGYGQEIFPNVPVVFCSVSGYEPSMRQGRELTGLVESIDIKATLDIALHLHPGTKDVAVIADMTQTGRAIKAKAEKAFQAYTSRLRIQYLEDLTINELKDSVSGLSEETIVFLFFFTHDKVGRVFAPEESLELLAQHCDVPIYGVWKNLLGHGIVGGMLTSGETEGRLAGEMALRILGGERASDIPLEKSPTQYMFDYARLEQFDLTASLLPEGSLIVNEPLSFYEVHKGLIWIAISVIVVLGIAVAVLTANIMERKHAETALRESEQRFRAVFESATEGILIADKEKKIFLAGNKKIGEMLGYGREEIPRIGVADIHPRQDLPQVLDAFEKAAKGEITLAESIPVKRKDGSVFFADISGGLVTLGGQECLIGSFRDVTERKRTEEEIARAWVLLHSVIEQSPVPMITALPDGTVQTYNQAALDNLGIADEPETQRGLNIFKHKHTWQGFDSDGKAVPVEDLPMAWALRGEPTKAREMRIVRKDGTERWILVDGVPIRDADGKLIAGFIVFPDITKRKLAEETVIKEKHFSETAMNSLPGLFYFFDGEGRLLRWNKNLEHVSGYTGEEIGKMAALDFFADEDRDLTGQAIQEVLEQGSGSVENRLCTKNGERIPFLFTGRRVTIEDAAFVVGMGIDITERKRSEALVRESEEKYRLLVDNADDAIFIAQDGMIRFPNPKTEEVTGYSSKELEKVPFLNLVHPEDRDMVLERHNKRLAGEEVPSVYSFRINDRKGQELWVEINAIFITWEGRPATLNFVRDITAQKRLEDQLRQAQKMEAIGTLAGGIAHDFNNVLAAIIGYTEMSLEDVPKGSVLQISLEEVLKAGTRAKDLVRQILTFSRQTERESRPLQLKPVLKEALKLLRASLPTTIDIRYDIQSESAVMGDPTQMHQVLMNLCANAGYAMEAGGGILTVRLAEVELDADFAAGHPEISPGPHLCLSVSDTGHGMDPSTVKRIFEPYFTTKEKGKGTGLGLAVVHGIVQGHGGTITVESEPGQGTTFHVYLPVIQRADEGEMEGEEALPMGRERILYVEDEEPLLNLGRQLLERLGYTVVTSARGSEALEAFRAEPDRFDLMITDMTMPGMTGDRLASEIMKIRPDIPIILFTGFSPTMTEEKAKALGIRAFVMKPLHQGDMARTVRQVLDD
ncbi:MAG: PAS domain S-box protein [Thermodesulfobacteriota bacterium]|nr:PAS domain S-box protein [Thermodesulfobacteriota bacterium]